MPTPNEHGVYLDSDNPEIVRMEFEHKRLTIVLRFLEIDGKWYEAKEVSFNTGGCHSPLSKTWGGYPTMMEARQAALLSAKGYLEAVKTRDHTESVNLEMDAGLRWIKTELQGQQTKLF